MTSDTNSQSFQGSETSGAEVAFYPQGGDPVVINSTALSFDGRSNRDDNPSLLSASTAKQQGAPSGTWNVSVKPGRYDIGDSFFERVIDDDWVDVSFSRHGRKWHVMRGLVDDVQRSESVSGAGATSTVFTISGRDFGKVFETTPIWFNPYSTNALGGAAAIEAFGTENIIGDPLKAVRGFLIQFFEMLKGEGQATWKMPPTMSNVIGPIDGGDPDFISTVVFPENLYQPLFDTVGINQNYLMPEGMLWQLAKEWSDPLFNELFVDTVPRTLFGEDPPEPGKGWGTGDTEMRITFRNRPFPTTLGSADYFGSNFPLHIVNRKDLVPSQVGRSGMERFNAYYASPQLLQETLQASTDMLMPLWDLEGIGRHGLRRFDVDTKYQSASSDDLVLAEGMRHLVRDWYCMNPYLLNGTLSLGVGRPEIQIGSRLQVPGGRSEDENETYYVESAAHSWQPRPGIRSSFGVTRGWVGSDASYMDALYKVTDKYSLGTRQEST